MQQLSLLLGHIVLRLHLFYLFDKLSLSHYLQSQFQSHRRIQFRPNVDYGNIHIFQ